MIFQLKAGQTLRITGECTIEVVDEAPKSKPGPKSLPVSDVPTSALHIPIMKFVSAARGPVTTQQVREHIAKSFSGATTNTVSWALVELQFEGCRRGRNRAKTGPLVKNADGTYSARSTQAQAA